MRSIREGLGYLRGQRALQGTFLIDINAMVFGMPRALFPELGLTQFGGGAQAVGLLYAAPGMGAFVAAVTTGWVGARPPSGPGRADRGGARVGRGDHRCSGWSTSSGWRS